MTLILKLDPDMVNVYLYAENRSSAFQKLLLEQTHRQTEIVE